MSHGHKVQKCAHGLIVAQCRCFGPKAVEVVACPPDCLLGGTPLSMKHGAYDPRAPLEPDRNFAADPPQICVKPSFGVDPTLTPEFNRLQEEWAKLNRPDHGDECPCGDCNPEPT